MNTVIYARYSSDNQREESIEGQLRECQAYAEQIGLTIIGTYIDRAYSAKTDNRPEFRRMIKDSAKKMFEVVLVWKLDRFARSREDSAMNKYILKRNGVKVMSAKEGISDRPEGIILEAMLEGYAEYFSVELSEKVVRGMTENALKGKHNGGLVPFGYTIDKEQYYHPDPLTAPVVVECFKRYADGESLQRIAIDLNTKGIRTRYNKAMSINSIMTVLKNRKYIGEYKYRDTVVPDVVPVIVDVELFNIVQECIKKNKRAPARSKAIVEYLLTTKLFCGECGTIMAGESGTSVTGRTYHYYKCGNAKRRKGCKKKAIKKDLIEKLVVEYTKNTVLQDEMIDRLADAIIALHESESAMLPQLERQLKEVEKGLENMLDAIQQGMLTPSTKQRLDELEEQKENLRISIAQENLAKPLMTKEHIVFWISRFKDGDIDDIKYQRDIIDIFVNAVFVYDDKIILTFNYKDGTKTITLDEINSSDLTADATPRGK